MQSMRGTCTLSVKNFKFWNGWISYENAAHVNKVYNFKSVLNIDGTAEFGWGPMEQGVVVT